MPEQPVVRYPRLSKQAAKELDDFEPIGVRASLHNQQEPEKIADQLRKQAQMMIFDGSPNTPRVPLLYMDPLLDPLLFLYPKGESREALKQINVRLRHYYETHRLVGNIIDLHSEFPLSDFQLRTSDPIITKYYNDFKDRTDLLSQMVYWLRDYWLLGETFIYGNWDADNRMWTSFNQYPPEAVGVKSLYVGGAQLYSLFTDDDPELKRICTSSDSRDKAIRDSLPAEFVASVRTGQPVTLDNSRLLHFARRPTTYARRGISIVRRAIKDLMYEDKLRCLQLTFVDRHMFPIKLFKLGDRSLGWIPSQKHFAKFQTLLAQAANDPDFSIVYHFGIEVDYIGTKDKIANLIPEFEFVEKSVLTALFANDTVVHGDMSTYAGQAISMRVLLNRYLTVRTQLEIAVKNKIFLPLARENGFVDKNTGEYILPEYVWEKTNLLSNTTQQDFAMRLRDKGDLPFDLICDIFGWDKKTIEQQLKDEQGTVFDPVWKEIYKKKAETDFISEQVFAGKKSSEWEKEEKKEKKEIIPEESPSNLTFDKRLEKEEPSFQGKNEVT